MDPIETCPYDESHRIRRSRKQWHITVCSKNHKQDNKKHCYYDASHVISEDQFEEHLRECPARGVAMKSLSSDEHTEDVPYILPIDTNTNSASDDWGTGEWGNDANFETYKPLEAVENKPIVHAKIGLSKAQRKKHRFQERRRYNEVMQNNAKSNGGQ